MTEEEILSLYKKAYKEAAEAYRPGVPSDQASQRKDWNLQKDFQNAMQRLADQQAGPLDYQRRALARVYGNNHLNSLDDDAYVQRRWNAAMQGSRVNQLWKAYQRACRTGNGMSAGSGMAYGGDRNINRLGTQYGAGTPRQRPTVTRQAWTQQMKSDVPYRAYNPNNPTARRNAQSMAKQQAARHRSNMGYKTTAAVPDGVKKEMVPDLTEDK